MSLPLFCVSLQDNLLFASIISAVDPVAALNAFEDTGVNEQIYIVIFGEALFNDAVTVVLYSMFAFLADMPNIDSVDVFLATYISTVSKITINVTDDYIVVCAITMKYHVEENVSQTSCTTIRHVVKMLSTVSETLIFFFLGVVTVTTEHEWSWAYILFTLLFAFVWRGIGILLLTQIVNPLRTISFNKKDQFGLAYGGLRGAICFALSFMLPDTFNRRKLFVTVSIAIIIFTVFIQRRDEGGVSTQEEVPDCRREENARPPGKEHIKAALIPFHYIYYHTHTLPYTLTSTSFLSPLYPRLIVSLHFNPSGHNVSKSQKYFSLQPGASLESGLELRRRSRAGGEARFQSGAFLRSSSRSLVTAKKLNTIKELGSPGESPAVSADSLAEYPSVTILDERASRRANSKPEEEENVDSEHLGRGRGGEEPVRPPPLPPPGGENEAGNPLLRHSSQGPRGTGRS
ncbi:hypothetical protein ACER0C_007472 [Sarotherodon galilaeus]